MSRLPLSYSEATRDVSLFFFPYVTLWIQRFGVVEPRSQARVSGGMPVAMLGRLLLRDGSRLFYCPRGSKTCMHKMCCALVLSSRKALPVSRCGDRDCVKGEWAQRGTQQSIKFLNDVD